MTKTKRPIHQVHAADEAAEMQGRAATPASPNAALRSGPDQPSQLSAMNTPAKTYMRAATKNGAAALNARSNRVVSRNDEWSGSTMFRAVGCDRLGESLGLVVLVRGEDVAEGARRRVD